MTMELKLRKLYLNYHRAVVWLLEQMLWSGRISNNTVTDRDIDLLVIEKVLSESSQPKRVTCTSSPSDKEPENTTEPNPHKTPDVDQPTTPEGVMGVVSVIGKHEDLPLA